jgi:hypothetical protein
MIFFTPVEDQMPQAGSGLLHGEPGNWMKCAPRTKNIIPSLHCGSIWDGKPSILRLDVCEVVTVPFSVLSVELHESFHTAKAKIYCRLPVAS